MRIPSFEARACAVCGSKQNTLLYQQVFSEISSGGSLLSGYDVVVCEHCGFCFANGIPEQAHFDAYYRDMSKYEKSERGGQKSPYEKARFQSMAEVILNKLEAKHTRIFEVGCANGELLALLKKAGYENVSGIDPSPVSAKIAEEVYGIHVSADTLSSMHMDHASVDFLILAGVLEHVCNLNSALQRLRELLSSDAYLFVTVPDASRYAEGEDAPFQEFSVEHINFFGPDSLVNLLQANGFAKVSIEQNVIESNYRTTTPVIHGLFKNSPTTLSFPFSRDIGTEIGLKMYIDQSVKGNVTIQDNINSLVNRLIPIVVWGTGAHTLRLLATSRLREAKIKAFVDSNPRYQGKSLNNVPIIAPQALKEMTETILISSRVYQEEIADQIRRDLKLGNELVKLY
jgi:SAM-dependent methyltransferase